MRSAKTVKAIVDYLVKHAEITLACEPEDFPPEDSFDDPHDVAWAKEQIENGNEWGWCVAHVTATIEIAGATFQGNDYLGGCSYESEAAFKHPDGYYPDMVREACLDIANQIMKAEDVINAIRLNARKESRNAL